MGMIIVVVVPELPRVMHSSANASSRGCRRSEFFVSYVGHGTVGENAISTAVLVANCFDTSSTYRAPYVKMVGFGPTRFADFHS